ncbi:hypothetical protein PRZ48_000182 [Zasmidium cellare]|uniref:Uncharacterized protein n=1 Tax=Zasmidium cellare TaxID=395010 RepID=A0ABR0EYC6_ZASCE|nr:hypothetical protein PRZ48_000182 [Zasmidium cellare]
MDPLFTKQIHSLTSSTRLSLLHGLKSVLSYTNYSFGAVYESIDGPHSFGSQPFEIAQAGLPLLTLLGGERAVGRHAKTQRHRQRTSFVPEDLFKQSGIPPEPFCADDLVPMNITLGRDGLHSPAQASYLIYIDILSDASAHTALHSLGRSEFHRIPGWLSESVFESRTAFPAGVALDIQTKTTARFVCMQAFEHSVDLGEVQRVLGEFAWGTGGKANFKVRVYKLFGSVGRGM